MQPSVACADADQPLDARRLRGCSVTDGPGLRLQTAHQQVVGEPLPEWLEEASCGPSAKHLAHLALHAAETGQTAAQWRTWVNTHLPDVSAELFAEAEECMRGAGLWPWRD